MSDQPHATGSRAAKIHPRLGTAMVVAFLGLPSVALAAYGWLPVAAWFAGMVAIVMAAFFLRRFTWDATR